MKYHELIAAAGPAGTLRLPVLAPQQAIDLLSEAIPLRRLVVDRVLGLGGSGIVYAASLAGGEADLAVKVPLTLGGNLDLLWEARFAPPRSLKISGAVEWIGASRAKLPVLSDLEVIVGISRCYPATIHSRLESSDPLDPRTALRWIIQASQALDTMGIVHRDIKPDNIFIDTNDNCRVADFGLAIPGSLGLRSRDEYAGNYFVGTPEYASPEQWAGDEEIDHRSDIYSLGLVLFEMVTRKPARARRMQFASDDNQYGSILARTRYALDLHQVAHDSIRDLLAKATRPNPSRRHETHRDFQAACRKSATYL
jgi:hypothetical protein